VVFYLIGRTKRIIQKFSIVALAALFLTSCQTTSVALPTVAETKAPLTSPHFESGQIVTFKHGVCENIKDLLKIHKFVTVGDLPKANAYSAFLFAEGKCFYYTGLMKLAALEMKDTYKGNDVELWSVWLTPDDRDNKIKHYLIVTLPPKAEPAGFKI
jgi:hypothetical protein